MIRERLIKAIKHKYPQEGGQAQCARDLGIEPKALSAIMNRRNQPKTVLMEKVYELFPEFAYWIATGKTQPKAGNISPDLEQLEQLKKKVSGEA